jgi:hypothetical protein
MTALSWFYLGVDSDAPDTEGGEKTAVEPYYSLCKTKCVACGEDFATYDYRCPNPKCREFNNTMDRTPKIGMTTDIRSPLVTASSNPHVIEQYKNLQDYFMWVLKIGWAAKQAVMDEKNDVFYDKYYRHLAENYAKFLASGGKSVSSSDIPKFLQWGRVKSLPIRKGNADGDAIRAFFTIDTECPKCGSASHPNAIGSCTCDACGHSFTPRPKPKFERGILSFCERLHFLRSTSYDDFVKSLGGLSPQEVLPKSSEPLWGNYDVSRYKSLDGWEDKNTDARLLKVLDEILKKALGERWDTARFEGEFLTMLKTFNTEEKKRLGKVAQMFVEPLSLIGIDFLKIYKQLWAWTSD